MAAIQDYSRAATGRRILLALNTNVSVCVGKEHFGKWPGFEAACIAKMLGLMVKEHQQDGEFEFQRLPRGVSGR